MAAFDIAASLAWVDGLPVPDWQAASAWVASIADADADTRAEAWGRVELAWLAHMQHALGAHYNLVQHEQALLLSPLEPRAAQATVQFMTRTLARIGHVLAGIAQAPSWGKDILVVFEHQEDYYRYVARYYPDEGEFAFSSGMHIDFGCSHFVTRADDLRAIEPVIVHEMTHACLGHLDIPAWLNEGLAVNTERRLCPPMGQRHTPQQLHQMHQRFWTAQTIQEFWNGTSFLRTDDGNLLSYELARILTEQFARDWARFSAFAREARRDDAGHAAALRHLDADLGVTVCALFGFEPSAAWSPAPACWPNPPERGAF